MRTYEHACKIYIYVHVFIDCMYVYIRICEVLVQPLGEGKLRGDQLPPPHSPLHLS